MSRGPAIGGTWVQRVQRVHKVQRGQRVQRVVVAASPQILKKGRGSTVFHCDRKLFLREISQLPSK